jgi:hypothetical protein
MPLHLNRNQKRIAQYITRKRQLKRSISSDGKALFSKLAQDFSDQLADIRMDCNEVGYLVTAFNIALGIPNPAVPERIQEEIVQVFRTALFGLELSSVEMTYLDAGRSSDSPNGILTLEFNEHKFMDAVAAKMDLRIDAPISVTWDFNRKGSPSFELPLTSELDLEDLEFYYEIFKERWDSLVFDARMRS